MTIVVAGLVAVLLALSRGGSFDSLARTKLRMGSMVIAGLILQVLFDIWAPEWLTAGWALSIVLASNALIFAFVLLNRRTPGMPAIGLGVLLNVIVISANGAMPVSTDAIRVAEVTSAPNEESLKHEVLGPHTRLPWLGDVLPLPRLKEILSIGDVALLVGIGLLIYGRMVDQDVEAPAIQSRTA